MGEPPSLAGADQFKVTEVVVISEVCGADGASGTAAKKKGVWNVLKKELKSRSTHQVVS